MPTIVFASPKGSVGKSTAAVLLAGKPANLTVLADVTEDSIIDTLESAALKTPFVIVDLEGTASMMVGYAPRR